LLQVCEKTAYYIDFWFYKKHSVVLPCNLDCMTLLLVNTVDT